MVEGIVPSLYVQAADVPWQPLYPGVDIKSLHRDPTQNLHVMLMRSDLTGTWYVVTDYTHQGEGHYRSKAKHRLPSEMQEQLERMRSGNLAWLDVRDLYERKCAATAEGCSDDLEEFLAELRAALDREEVPS